MMKRNIMSKKKLNKCDELIERLTELKKVLNATDTSKYTSVQIAAIEEANKLKKNTEKLPWVTHARMPNADAEVKRVQRTNPVVKGEDALVNQLTKVMVGKNMLGIRPPPQLSANDFIKAGEQMGLAPSEEQIQKAEKSWGNTMNWLEEAVKPISSRFKSAEEEEKYWASIKVSDRDDGKPGF